MSDRSIWAARAITPQGVLERVRLEVRSGRIAELLADTDPGPDDERFDDATLVAGLVDLQVNGADGGSYDDPDPAARRRATDYHLRSGTTSLLATLVTAPLDHLEAALRRLAPEVSEDGPVLGVHLEGPFLSEAKSGAHASRNLCDPTPGALSGLLDAAGPSLRMLTLAPEREGALDAIERLAKAGVVTAAGHSLASFEQLRAAIDRGLSFVTHVGNASDWPSRPYDEALGYRRSEPGLIGAFMVDERLRGSVILDGRHLHPQLAAALYRLRKRALLLVSDATPAAGLPPGEYPMGALRATVHSEGYATAGQGLAGSTITLLDAVRIGVDEAGIPLPDALHMASEGPASLIGAQRKGRLATGCDADLLLLNERLEVRALYRAGAPVVTGKVRPGASG
ncbi:MAG: amidohydrolase family protein [bacterium]|nr:amidohydrolase family protein [bacterium]